MRLIKPIIWFVSLLLVVSLTRSVVSLLAKKDIVRTQKEELARLEEENKKLEDALSQAQTPEFVERTAREKLGLVKDGEVVVMLPQGAAGEDTQAQTESLPNWKQWWGLFF
jgi:cell division protein FtsB